MEEQEPTEARAAVRVAVVGGGLAGLRAANGLAASGCDVVLLDERENVGGKAAGGRIGGFSIDRTLQVLSSEDRRLLRWVGDLGLASSFLPMRPVSVAHLHAAQVIPCEASRLRGIARTPGVRLRDAFRLLRLPRLMERYAGLLDSEAPERAAALDFRSVADFARLYLGRSVFEHFAAPFVSASTLGDAHELSRVAFLLLWQASRYGAVSPAIAAIGLSEVAEAAAAVDGLEVRTRARVEQLKELPSGGFAVDVAGGESLEVAAVVVATKPAEADRIATGTVTPAERDFLRAVSLGPLVTLSAALDQAVTGLPQLVRIPRSERSPIEVVLVEPGVPGGRVPEGCGLVTLSATSQFALRRARDSDDVIETELTRALACVLPGVGRRIRFSKLHRDELALPRFEVGAYREMARFRSVQRDRCGLGRRLYFAGDYLAGPRFEDAVASGARAAADLLADLGPDGRPGHPTRNA